ncbi:amidohydrolase family protein [Leptospira selangorensis]|uniref:Amidohydrolase family protein n=1 Tax=Leptospira selangorensis TaxID=2484982 RepID=A0A5F2C6Z7_9LEPT|nr:amidohydrolase family protein [Leptospira selangorensis]TGM12802.1 amidohydrolase family protein [Leptospira selangorensis]TGM30863.1 amidohydrolase family protein [Leptospira selangorensis]
MKFNEPDKTYKRSKQYILKTFTIAVITVIATGYFPIGCKKSAASEDQTIAIINANIFDGENLIKDRTLVIKGNRIHSIGGDIPAGARIVDANGGMLMPGLIDSHVHTDIDGLHDALLFGVTTELEMTGQWMFWERWQIANRTDLADIRSAGMGITPPGGHPTQYMQLSSNWFLKTFYRYPFVSTPEEAIKFVDKQVEEGSDFIKIIIENGDTVGTPGLPVIDDATLIASVKAAHRHGKMAIAHVTSVVGGRRAISAGVDGLAHMFFDEKPDKELISAIRSSGAFIVPTLTTLSTAFGNSPRTLVEDKRVNSKLSKEWLEALSKNMNVYPKGKLENSFESVMALHKAGVDILAGSDVSEPIADLGGLAHGASLHHELQLLVAAGFKPIEALRAATSVPARRFSLNDRGRIFPGGRADLLLIDGNPTQNISDTLSIRNVWCAGVQQ